MTLAGVRHSGKKVLRMLERSRARVVRVRVMVTRTQLLTKNGGRQYRGKPSGAYVATACIESKGFRGGMARNRCGGLARASTPTKAIKKAMASLAKVVR